MPFVPPVIRMCRMTAPRSKDLRHVGAPRALASRVRTALRATGGYSPPDAAARQRIWQVMLAQVEVEVEPPREALQGEGRALRDSVGRVVYERS